MWRKDLLPYAEAYAFQHGLQLVGVLGDGADGNVWRVRRKGGHIVWALKMHRDRRAYERERDCYGRLAKFGVDCLEGHAVPVLIRTNDAWKVIEMSIVERPFVLDFAGAYLDLPQEFSPEVWAERGEHWREIFGELWPRVIRIREALEVMGIYLTDLHLDNIAPE